MMVANIFILVMLVFAGMYFLVMAVIVAGLYRSYPTAGESDVHTKVTVIVPARNEANNITHCLNGISDQDYPKELTEVIVADDHSADTTAELVAKYASIHHSLRIRLLRMDQLPGSVSSKKAVIEAAVEVASGDLVITTDADTSRGKNWLSTVIRCYEQDQPCMILGPVAFTDGNSIFGRLQSLEFMGLAGATAGSCRAGFPIMCNGANLAYQKKIFMDTAGYQGNRNIASGDDIFLMSRIRKEKGARSIRFLLDEDAIVNTDPAVTFREFLSQRKRWVSKSKSYHDPLIISVALITWIFNFLLAAGLTAGIFSSTLLWTSLVLLVIKLAIEFVPVYFMAEFFGKRKLLSLYPLAGILNIPYTILIGIAGTFFSFRWKGRKIRNSSSAGLQPGSDPRGE